MVVIVDDVFFTGRTIRSGLDAIMTFGRPKTVEFLTLIERRFTQHLPIRADYIGQSIDTINEERVSVLWKEVHGKDQILLYSLMKMNDLSVKHLISINDLKLVI